jgi:hypothetical protein
MNIHFAGTELAALIVATSFAVRPSSLAISFKHRSEAQEAFSRRPLNL